MVEIIPSKTPERTPPVDLDRETTVFFPQVSFSTHEQLYFHQH